jgi:hypothetical protein
METRPFWCARVKTRQAFGLLALSFLRFAFSAFVAFSTSAGVASVSVTGQLASTAACERDRVSGVQSPQLGRAHPVLRDVQGLVKAGFGRWSRSPIA